jgi:hypothetical protein
MQTERHEVLERFGFARGTIDRLLSGLARSVPPVCPDPAAAAFENELFVSDWIDCCLEARRRGAVPALQDFLFELNFPIAGGISGSPEYQSLALAGHRSLEEVRRHITVACPTWEEPDGMRVFLHDTGAGLLPVIHAASRTDFVTLVRAIVHRNEPVPIPRSMGSNFINGYTNRRRYLRVREALVRGVLGPESRNPQLWRDKLLLLTSGPYSGISPETMGLDPSEWNRRSTAIRLHHESCHYIARRLFPELKFGIQDELVADFVGLTEATGRFRAADFLHFMGLENHPECRADGRLKTYDRKLMQEPEASEAIARLLVAAAGTLEEFFSTWEVVRYHREKLRIVASLTHLPLELLADASAGSRLQQLFPG